MKILRKWFGKSSSPRKVANRNLARFSRPWLELLEGRDLMSATSAITWSFYNPWTHTTTTHHDFYAIDAATHHILQYEDGVKSDLGAPQAQFQADDVSAGLQYWMGSGPAVYAHCQDGSIWVFTA